MVIIAPFDTDHAREALTSFLLAVLYALGTVISLVGTGFVIGVRLYAFCLRLVPFSDVLL